MHHSPQQYANYLAKRRAELAQLTKEMPFDPQPDLPEESNHRIDALRKKVIEAFLHANGDPADGRWMLMAHLLRTGVTRGRYRWIGARVDEQEVEPGSQGWLNANTDTEWAQWESKWRSDKRLRKKVESWKQTMSQQLEYADADKPDPLQPPSASKIKHDTANTNPLGFKVTKPSALANSQKPPNHIKASISITPDVRNITGSCAKQSRNNLNSNAIQIGMDRSDSTFLPPSFPSQLDTSTPRHGKCQKPLAIPRSPPCSSLQSPKCLHVEEGRPDPKLKPVNHQSRLLMEKEPRSTSPRRSFKEAILNSDLTSPAIGQLPVSLEPTPSSKILKPSPTIRIANLVLETKASVPLISTYSAANAQIPAQSDYSPSAILPIDEVQSLSLLDDGEDEFNPPVTSTQLPRPNGNLKECHKGLWARFNSQVNVDQRVDDVTRLLENDIDYHQWYKQH
ncbi:hypothetical protein AMATHDRAFT_1184 [Amanita thiersii Skay4041]|uniref:Uncharacterized protein n=1 Tax=Amanita thiersii Skay4041 TaxID=703135 RepID=A0A2A9NZK3_9AGAR|nr:hypothetical protein AMATHDRAFT_1184 [Amanita thiersii Skay4041]